MERLLTTCPSFKFVQRLVPLDSTSAAALPRAQFEPPILHLFNPGGQRLTGYVISFYEAKFEGLLVVSTPTVFIGIISLKLVSMKPKGLSVCPV